MNCRTDIQFGFRVLRFGIRFKGVSRLRYIIHRTKATSQSNMCAYMVYSQHSGHRVLLSFLGPLRMDGPPVSNQILHISPIFLVLLGN